MAKKFYTREKEINGTKYVAQFNGLGSALDAIDNSYIAGTDRISIKKISGFVFENVIVEPKGLSADDFDDFNELNEVVNFGVQVMQGKFRNEEKNENTAK